VGTTNLCDPDLEDSIFMAGKFACREWLVRQKDIRLVRAYLPRNQVQLIDLAALRCAQDALIMSLPAKDAVAAD